MPIKPDGVDAAHWLSSRLTSRNLKFLSPNGDH